MYQLGIIHLSDVHFTYDEESNWVWANSVSLCDAVARSVSGCTDVLLVFSGDLSQQGLEDEYLVAATLVQQIELVLSERGVVDRVDFVCCPGNHDNDFTEASPTRSITLPHLDDAGMSDAAVIDEMTSPQNHFFNFAQQMEGLDAPLSGLERLVRVRRFSFGGKTFTFNLLNTAWTSERHEQYGELRWPSALKIDNEGDHVFTVMHHPISWMRPEEGQGLRALVEANSDYILTGHIHRENASQRSYTTGANVFLMESAALQERGAVGQSGFSVLKIHTWSGEHNLERYSLVGKAYIQTEQASKSIILNPARQKTHLQLSDEFSEFLNDPGHGLNHPRATQLSLSDFYVMPTLMCSGDAGTDDRKVHSSAVVETLLNKKSLVVGPELSGKTAMARMVFSSLRKFGANPLYIDGEKLFQRHAKDLESLVNELSARIYSDGAAENIWNSDYEDRVFIIDGLEKCTLKPKQIRDVLTKISANFGTILLFAADSYLLSEMLSDSDSATLDFEHYKIAECGYRARGEIVRKWYSIGLSGDESDSVYFERSVASISDQMNEAIRKNFVPAYPAYFVLMLQSIDSSQTIDPSLGSYGQLYQAVIFQHLFAGDQSIDTETKANFLAALAGWIGPDSNASLQLSEAKSKYADLADEYDLAVSWEEMWKAISRTRLVRDLDGNISFSYPFVHAFFSAQHIAQQLDHDQRFDAVKSLVDNIHLDSSSSTLLCLLQHTKDKGIIDLVLERAKSILKDYETPTDLDGESKFVNDLINETPRKLLCDQPIEDARRDHLNMREQADDYLKTDVPAQDTAEIQALSTEFNAGYRVVQVIGQILRAFSGSLRAEQKRELCAECFNVGLRTLSCYLLMAKEEGEDFAQQIASGMKESFPDMDDAAIASATSKRLFFLLEIFGFSVLRHLSRAVGHYRLNKTLAAVLDSSNSSHKLIRLTVELDHYPEFPKDLVKDIHKNFKSKYTMAVARDLVWLHLHLVQTERETRQQVCELLGIKMLPKVLYDKELKKLPPA